jgi:hypothetical protein
MRLVRDPKAAASLLDGVRKHLCCPCRRGPLYYSHHTMCSCDGACAGEQTRARPVRLAAVLQKSSLFQRHQRTLLIAQSRGDRTLDTVAPFGSLARLRADVESIYGALLLGELPLALFERRMPSTSPGLRRRPNTPAVSHQAGRCRRQTRLPCPCRRPCRRCALRRPRRARPALSPVMLPAPRPGRQLLLLLQSRHALARLRLDMYFKYAKMSKCRRLRSL